MKPVGWFPLAVLLILSWALILASCGTDPGVVTISDIEITENPRNRLSACVTFTTDVEATSRILIEGPDGHSWVVGPAGGPAIKHELWVLGMYDESSYTFTIKAKDADGATGRSETLPFETRGLPSFFPPIEITLSEPDLMQPGWTLFNVYRYIPVRDFLWGMLIAVDETGRVVWYYKAPTMIISHGLLSNGNIVYGFLSYGYVEIDWTGRYVRSYSCFQMGLPTMHHDLYEMPSGDFLSFSTEAKNIDGYPVEGGGTTNYNVIGDIVIEFTPDGTLLEEWKLFDYLDPLRTKYGFHDETFWAIPYFYLRHPKDWSHANSIIYDASDNTFIISLRNQDWMVKIDRETGELLWRLGEDGDFVMAGDGEWPFHQHSPELLENGNILVYDNGQARSTLEEGEVPFSRVVEFNIDEEAMTATQVWEYRGEEPYFCPFLGDANRLENGNILITDGTLVSDPEIHELDPANHKSMRIVEVTYEDHPQKVFELQIDDTSGLFSTGYTAYRAVRIPGFN